MFSLLGLVLACGPQKKSSTNQNEVLNPTQEEKTSVHTPSTTVQPRKATIILDGKEVSVVWDDGDTFAIENPEGGKNTRARLKGFNTLESYGPVHQWGEWSAAELYMVAKQAGVFAASKTWICSDTQKGGGYGRILVDCPELRASILEVGLAHPFSIGSAAPDVDLAALKRGMERKVGMWAKGTPSSLITSLHSQDEKPDKDAYNRVCSLDSGECKAVTHTETYQVCQKVCVEDSCMVYVPYSQRYGENKAHCLKK